MKNAMKIKCIALVTLSLVFTNVSLASKDGNSVSAGSSTGNSFGVRFGVPYGFTFKHFTNSNTAFEFILGGGHPSLGLTVLYEKHTPLSGAAGFYWEYGFGGHAGFYRDGYYYAVYNNRTRTVYDSYAGPNIGVDGILGLEYRVREIPFTFGIDLKPYLDFAYPSFGIDGAFSVRFNF